MDLEPDQPNEREWTERVIRVAGLFGLNAVRLRWKLMAWQRRADERKQRSVEAAAHVKYRHAVCPSCRRVNPRGTKRCAGCDAALLPPALQAFHRMGVLSGEGLSVTTGLAVLILLAFTRQMLVSGSIWMFGVGSLVPLGAHVPQLEHQGEWWRLGTAVFLHGGLLHVGMNLMAMSQIGPAVEEVFGRGRMLFLYLLTGVLGFVPGYLMHSHQVSIGASGAIMGLIGAAAGWGHREGTTAGLAVRNRMIKWLVYVTILGFFVRADHVAHVVGFVAGGVIGLVSRPRIQRGSMPSVLDMALGITAGLVSLALVVLIVTRRVAMD